MSSRKITSERETYAPHAQHEWREWLIGPAILLGTGGVLWLLGLTRFHLPPSPIILLALVYVAFRGGRGPGLLCAFLLVMYHALYQLMVISRTHELADLDIRRVIALTLVAPSLVMLVGSLKLRLEQTVAAEAAQAQRQAARRLGELRLRTVADAVPVLIAFVDRSLRYQFNNHAYAEWLGEEYADVTGRTLWDVLGPEATRERLPMLERAISGETVQGEWKLLHRQLGLRILETHYVPFLDERGNIEGIVILATDITDRSRELRRQQLLNSVSALLSRAEHPDQVLDELVSEVVPELSDWCSVYRPQPDGSIQQVALAGPSPEMVQLEREIERRWRIEPGRNTAVPTTLRTGESRLVERVDLEVLRAIAKEEEHLLALQKLNLVSYLSVPLQWKGQNWGSLTMGSSTTGVYLTRQDLAFAEELARRLALAMEHADLLLQLRRSEERYRSVVHATTSVVWTTDAEGAISEPQPIWEHYTGQTWEQSRGWGWLEKVHPEDREEFLAAWKEGMRSRSGADVSVRLWNASSESYRHSTARAVPITSPDGSVREWVASMSDVHDRWVAEQARVASEQRFRALFEQCPLTIQGFSPAGDAISANRAWELLWNTTRDQLQGYNVLHDPYLARLGVAPLVRKAFEGELVAIPELLFDPAEIGREGRPRWVEAHFFPVKNEAQEVVEMALMLLDVTERRAAEDELKRVNAELARARDAALDASHAKSAFLANMSHELRTPLNAIIGYSELIREEMQLQGNSRTALDLEKVLISGKHLLAVISDILDLSKIEAGKMELSLEDMDVTQVAQEALNLVAPLVEQNGNAVELRVQPGCPRIYADRTRLRQVLFNLLSNAAKFTSHGRIRLTCRSTSESVQVTVEDNGMGIAPDQLGQLFQKFHQLAPAARAQKGGTGLGLAISKVLVELMGGTISVESELGKGSHFHVSLPVASRETSVSAAAFSDNP